MTCRRAVYAAEPYHRVVDLPFGEKRGFEATTYRPWSLEVGRMLRLLIYTWEGTADRYLLVFSEFHFVPRSCERYVDRSFLSSSVVGLRRVEPFFRLAVLYHRSLTFNLPSQLTSTTITLSRVKTHEYLLLLYHMSRQLPPAVYSAAVARPFFTSRMRLQLLIRRDQRRQVVRFFPAYIVVPTTAIFIFCSKTTSAWVWLTLIQLSYRRQDT
jgi:hypothetical protein